MLEINLLPWRKQWYVRKQQIIVVLLCVTLVGICGLGIFSHYFLTNKISLTISQIELLKKNINSINQKINVAGEFSHYENVLSLLKRVQSQQSETISLFNNISRFIPKSAYFTHFSRQESQLTMSGRVQSIVDLAYFIAALHTVNGFEHAHIVEINRIAKFNMLHFKIQSHNAVFTYK